MTWLRGAFRPLIVLFIGLFGTTIAAWLVMSAEQARTQARFDALVDTIIAAVEGRLDEQTTILRGVASLFHASAQVDPEEFQRYVSRLRLAEDHPGVLGVGYARLIKDQNELTQTVSWMRASGEPGFRAWPPRERMPVSAILFLEPQSPPNRRALGFDMFGEPVRRTAMERALHSGRAALTGKVQLVQDAGVTGDAAGFLLYVPTGSPAGLGSDAARHAGWAYSPLRARELFTSALAHINPRLAAVRIYDGAPTASNLLFGAGALPAHAQLRAERALTFAGRSWTIEVTALSGFSQTSSIPASLVVFIGGVFVSILLSIVMLQQVRAAQRTRAEIARATVELRDANAALRAAAGARETAEAQIRQMQKIEAIGQLTGGIAHDFNNMLAIVIGNLDLAERRVDDPVRVRRALHMAKEGAARAAELTRRLLAFGRQQPLEPRVIDANRLLAGMSELLRTTIGGRIVLQTAPAVGLWPVEVDPGQLENALLNLAINARDAMPEGGTLTIETANSELDDGHAHGGGEVAPGQYVRITVRDVGTGMAPEVLEKVIEPFFTTKEVGKGSGLGLSQVYGFVKQSGGHLDIRSALGEGTSVVIHLPRSMKAVDTERAEDLGDATPKGRADELILVVEDEDGVRAITVDTLRELGYTVVHAANGIEALDVLARKGRPALLFTDIVMPRMNGKQLAEAAAALYPGLPILFMTGYTRDAIVHEGRLDADVNLISKPFTGAQLARKVRAVLDAAPD